MRIIVNGHEREMAADATVADLLDELELRNRPVAVEVNLDVVPRGEHGRHQLADNDRLEVVTLVGGG